MGSENFISKRGHTHPEKLNCQIINSPYFPIIKLTMFVSQNVLLMTYQKKQYKVKLQNNLLF